MHVHICIPTIRRGLVDWNVCAIERENPYQRRFGASQVKEHWKSKIQLFSRALKTFRKIIIV